VEEMEGSTTEPLPAMEPARGDDEDGAAVAVEPAVAALERGWPPARGRRPLLIVGVGLLVLLLAGAAYVGPGLLARPKATGGGAGMQAVFTSKGAGAGAKTVSMKLEPAKELPQTKPDVAGVLTRRQDNSLYIGTGKVMMLVSSNGPRATPSFDGPVVEVVVTHDTQVFHDVTEFGMPKDMSSGQTSIQQVVKSGSLDEISTNAMVQVWGEKRGDRTIATVLSYTSN
jgi:hypothetical protein